MREALLVGAGAGLGAATRFAITESLGEPASLTLLFAINVLGCALMGMFAPEPFWGTGFLGGFTTFSAVTVLTYLSDPLGALSIVVLSFVLCVGAWILGDAARHRRQHP